MNTLIAIDTLRKHLSGKFLSEMITPVTITVNGVPTKLILDVPRTLGQLELAKDELDSVYHSMRRQSK